MKADPVYTFDSSNSEVEEQFAIAAKEASALVDIKLPQGTDLKKGFLLKKKIYKADPFLFAITETDAHERAPMRYEYQSNASPYYFITLRLYGYCDVEVGDRTIRFEGQKLEMGSVATIRRASISRNKAFHLYFPKYEFERFEEVSKSLINRDTDDNMSSTLALYLEAIASALPHAKQDEIPQIALMTESVIRTWISCSDCSSEESQPSALVGQLEAAKKYIMTNLRSAALTPTMLQEELKVSRRQLYKIFEPVGGVSNFVRSAKLEASWREIVSGQETRPISVIAGDLGFSDHASFSNHFKAKFGCAPSGLRQLVNELNSNAKSELARVF